MNTLGIDFGTTKTIAGYWDADAKAPKLVRLGNGRDFIPTSILVDCNGEMVFGDEADDQSEMDPSGYLRRIKRDLGKGQSYFLNGRGFKAVDLVTQFLKFVIGKAESEALHGKVNHLVVTVPAAFGPAKRTELEQAIEMTGISSYELLDEPVAAAMAWLKMKGSLGNRILVFDWGGGTLDVAILERDDDGYRSYPNLICGNERLGGEDIDDSIIAAIDRAFLKGDFKGVQDRSLREQILIAKRVRDLKVQHTRKEIVKWAFNLEDMNEPWSWDLTRSEFNLWVEEPVQKACSCAKEAHSRALGLGKNIDQVILVGGSSKIQLVSQRLKELLGIEPLKWDLSIEAIAYGAAIKAARLPTAAAEPGLAPQLPPKPGPASAPGVTASPLVNGVRLPPKSGPPASGVRLPPKSGPPASGVRLPPRSGQPASGIPLPPKSGPASGVPLPPKSGPASAPGPLNQENTALWETMASLIPKPENYEFEPGELEDLKIKLENELENECNKLGIRDAKQKEMMAMGFGVMASFTIGIEKQYKILIEREKKIREISDYGMHPLVQEFKKSILQLLHAQQAMFTPMYQARQAKVTVNDPDPEGSSSKLTFKGQCISKIIDYTTFKVEAQRKMFWDNTLPESPSKYSETVVECSACKSIASMYSAVRGISKCSRCGETVDVLSTIQHWNDVTSVLNSLDIDVRNTPKGPSDFKSLVIYFDHYVSKTRSTGAALHTIKEVAVDKVGIAYRQAAIQYMHSLQYCVDAKRKLYARVTELREKNSSWSTFFSGVSGEDQTEYSKIDPLLVQLNRQIYESVDQFIKHRDFVLTSLERKYGPYFHNIPS